MPSAQKLRSVAVALACTVATIPMVAACGSSGSEKPSAGPVTLTMSAWGGDVDKKVYEQRLALAHKKYPNITVKLQMAPGGEDYSQKISTAIAGGKGPDILELAEQTSAFASKHQILPLDDKVMASKLDLTRMFGPTVPKIFQYDGQQYAIPDRSGAMVLYYNKKLFDQAGVGYPSADWSWDDLLAASRKLTVRDNGKVKQWGFATISWWPYWMTFMYQNGGRILDDKGAPVVDTPQNVAAMKWYNDLPGRRRSHPRHETSPTTARAWGPTSCSRKASLPWRSPGSGTSPRPTVSRVSTGTSPRSGTALSPRPVPSSTGSRSRVAPSTRPTRGR